MLIDFAGITFMNVPLHVNGDYLCDFISSSSISFPIIVDCSQMLPMSCSHYIRFYFESTLYRQIDGVVVGSPLDRTLADVFLSMTRSKLEDFISKLVLRKRNVDDITINVPTNFANVLNLLNSVHSNLSVSHEESND